MARTGEGRMNQNTPANISRPRKRLAYVFKSDPHPTRFKNFDRTLITSGLWAELPTCAHAVLPVLVMFANAQGLLRMTVAQLAAISGVDRFRTFPNGIDLILKMGDDFPVKREMWRTRNGRLAYRYRLPNRELQRGEIIPLRFAMFEGGNWAHLLLSARSLYMVMRAKGSPDIEDPDLEADYNSREGMDKEAYAKRESELCHEPQSSLMWLAGIKKHDTFRDCIQSLVDCGLCDPYDEDTGSWRVYLTPNRFFPSV